MMLMASAGDFITLYLGLELQSLALYVLAAFDRDNLRSTESGLEIFHSWRAFVGNDALRNFADLRLCRHVSFAQCRYAGSRREISPSGLIFGIGVPDLGACL